MSAAKVQESFAQSVGGGTSIAVTITVTAGNALQVWVTNDSTSGAVVTVDDSVNVGLYNQDTTVNDATNTQRTSQFHILGAAGGLTTITAHFSQSCGSIAIGVMEISGVSTYLGQNGQVQATPTTGTDATTSGAIAIGTAPAFLVGICCDWGGAATSPSHGTGFTTGTSAIFFTSAQTELLNLASTGSFAATYTAAVNQAHTTLGAIFGETLAPIINIQPTNQTTAVGSTATFSVSATASSGALSYQWYLNGATVGTNSSSYTTGPLAASANGSVVRCIVTDSNGSTTTNDVRAYAATANKAGRLFRATRSGRIDSSDLVKFRGENQAVAIASTFFDSTTTAPATLTAAQGSLALTGQATALTAQRKVVAAQASLALTGNATGLTAQRKITAAQATLAISGQTATLRANRVVAAVGSFALTGVAAGLRTDRKITAAQASFALTGQAAGFGTAMPAAQGSLALTGQVTALRATRVLTAATGSVVLTGQAVALRAARKITSAQASFALSGQSTGFGIGVTATVGTFALDGVAASLRIQRRLTAATSAFAATVADTGLVYGTNGSYTLSATRGSFALGGQIASITAQRKLSASNCSIVLTWQQASLLFGRKLSAVLESLSLTGQPVGILAGRKLVAALSSSSLTGISPGFLATRRLTAEQCAIVLTGKAAAFVTLGGSGIGVVMLYLSTELEPIAIASTACTEPTLCTYVGKVESAITELTTATLS